MERIFKKAEKALDRYQKAIDFNLPDSIIQFFKNKYNMLYKEISDLHNENEFLEYIGLFPG